MPSLADVAPPELAAEEIDVRGTLLKVRGLSGEEWMALYARFPEFAAVLGGKSDAQISGITEVRSQAALIASALGCPGDAATEALVLERLSGDDQRLVMSAAVRLSHPGHIFGPLLNGAAPVGPAPATEAPATK